MEQRNSLILFVDSGLPLNIYLFNQSTAGFKGGLGEVRGHGGIPQLHLQRRVPPRPPPSRKPRISHGQIEAQLNSIKLAPFERFVLQNPENGSEPASIDFVGWNLLSFDEKAGSTCR